MQIAQTKLASKIPALSILLRFPSQFLSDFPVDRKHFLERSPFVFILPDCGHLIEEGNTYELLKFV